MNSLEVLLAVYWMVMAVVSFVVVLCRKPLARWVRPRMRYWRNRADAHRLYERSMLLGGIGIGAFCLIALYGAVVVLPRLDRTLAEVRSMAPQVPRRGSLGPAI